MKHNAWYCTAIDVPNARLGLAASWRNCGRSGRKCSLSAPLKPRPRLALSICHPQYCSPRSRKKSRSLCILAWSVSPPTFATAESCSRQQSMIATHKHCVWIKYKSSKVVIRSGTNGRVERMETTRTRRTLLASVSCGQVRMRSAAKSSFLVLRSATCTWHVSHLIHIADGSIALTLLPAVKMGNLNSKSLRRTLCHHGMGTRAWQSQERRVRKWHTCLTSKSAYVARHLRTAWSEHGLKPRVRVDASRMGVDAPAQRQPQTLVRRAGATRSRSL